MRVLGSLWQFAKEAWPVSFVVFFAAVLVWAVYEAAQDDPAHVLCVDDGVAITRDLD